MSFSRPEDQAFAAAIYRRLPEDPDDAIWYREEKRLHIGELIAMAGGLTLAVAVKTDNLIIEVVALGFLGLALYIAVSILRTNAIVPQDGRRRLFGDHWWGAAQLAFLSALLIVGIVGASLETHGTKTKSVPDRQIGAEAEAEN